MGWLFFDKILRMGIGVIVGVLVARYLGPKLFGLLNYAQSLVALFAPVASLGLDNIVVRNIIREPKSILDILGTTFILKLIAALFVVGIMTGTIVIGDSGNTEIHLLVAIIAMGMVVQAFDTIDFWFQSQVLSKNTVIAKNAAFIIISLFKVLLIYIKAPLVAFAWAGTVELALGAIGLVLIYWRSGNNPLKWQASFLTAKQLLRESWPLIFSSLTIVIYMRIDQVMLGRMLGASAVGIYSAAVRISEVWYFIPMAVFSSIAPYITETKKNNEQAYYERLQYLFNGMVGTAIVIAIIVSLSADKLIIMLFGSEYSAAGPVLTIHIWAAIFVFLGVVRGLWIINEGLMKWAFATNVIGAIMNILLNLMLIPLYGIIGSAVATVFSYMIATYLACGFYKKTRIIFYMQTRSLFWIFYKFCQNRS